MYCSRSYYSRTMRISFLICVLALLLFLILDDDLVTGQRRWGFRRSRFGRSRRRYNSGGSRYGSYPTRRRGLSKGARNAMFAGAGALAGIYLGSQLARVSSIRQLDKYEICEGRPSMIDDDFYEGDDVERDYSHFICPNNPNQPFNRYCCYDGGRSFCCAGSSRSRGGLIGGLTTILLIILIIGLCIYCCRRKRAQAPSTYVQPPPPAPMPGPTNVVIAPGGMAQPYGPPGPVPAYPAPGMAPYPQPDAAAQPGAGWMPAGGVQPGYPTNPPPPYPTTPEGQKA